MIPLRVSFYTHPPSGVHVCGLVCSDFSPLTHRTRLTFTRHVASLQDAGECLGGHDPGSSQAATPGYCLSPLRVKMGVARKIMANWMGVLQWFWALMVLSQGQRETGSVPHNHKL